MRERKSSFMKSLESSHKPSLLKILLYTIIKPNLHINRKDLKHMFVNMFSGLPDMAWSSYCCNDHIFAVDVLTALTLPVQRYLVPTPSTKEGGLSRPPHDFEKGRLYKLQLWQAIRTMRGKKTGGVDDLSLVRFPWQLFNLRVFSTKFC